MTIYRVVEAEEFSNSQISEEMFGLNFVTTFDYDIVGDQELMSRLSDLNSSVLRFPGGTTTEYAFADGAFSTGNWEASMLPGEFGIERIGTPLSDFFEVAGKIGVDAQLVIPTRVAFSQSAGQALIDGTYGSRRELSADYFDNVAAFIEQSLIEATANNVTISRFELGNEFWGGGEMTAFEYGYLASRLATFLNSRYPDIEILTQVTSSSNRFSQRNDTSVYLEPDGEGDYTVWLASELGHTLPEGWVHRTMSGQGNAAEQTRAIADQLIAHPGALDAISGILEHVYFEDGFSGIDSERNFSLYSIYNRFIERTGLPEIDYFVTEWSPRNPRNSNDDLNLGNANGLHLAHSTIEAFFELASAGIDGANFWPLTFGNPRAQDRTLIDTEENDLTFSGLAFQWLQASTLGLTAQVDYEVPEEVDVHIFGNAERYTLFVGERTGTDRSVEGASPVELDLENVITPGRYVVTTSTMGTDGAVDVVETNPIIQELTPFAWNGGSLSLDLGAWELAMIEVLSVSDVPSLSPDSQDDLILAASADQRDLTGGAGDDLLIGDGQSNTIHGNEGNDRIYSYAGNDEIYAGYGDDLIYSGDGNDTIHATDGGNDVFSGTGDDLIYASGSGVYSGGLGFDHIDFSLSEHPVNLITNHLFSLSGNGNFEGFEAITASNGDDEIRFVEDVDFVFLGEGDDLSRHNGGSGTEIFGEGGHDRIILSMNSIGYGGEGNDTLVSNDGDEFLFGGAGNDHFIVRYGTDHVSTGSGSDTIWIQSFEQDNHIIVSDFDLAYDSISLFGMQSFEQLFYSGFAQAYQSGDDMIMEADHGWRVTLRDIDVQEFFLA